MNPHQTISHIMWKSWSPTSAVGVGIVVDNTCVPDCAQSKIVTYQGTVVLTSPMEYDGYLVFNVVTLNPPIPTFQTPSVTSLLNGATGSWGSFP